MGQTASSSTHLSPQGVVVVHINGHVDEFVAAVKVKEVVSKHESRLYIVCRGRELQQHLHGVRPLSGEEELRKGEIYMVMPISSFNSDVSPTNLATVCNRLLLAAKRQVSNRSCARRKARESRMDCSSGYCKMYGKVVGNCEDRELEAAYKEHLQVIAKRRSWKPRLHTIPETCLAR